VHKAVRKKEAGEAVFLCVVSWLIVVWFNVNKIITIKKEGEKDKKNKCVCRQENTFELKLRS
jgi:hypothetical protein